MEYNIFYLLPIDEEIEFYTPFQGFSFEILRVSTFIHKILHLPANIVELYAPRKGVISARMSGYTSYMILPLYKNLMSSSFSFREMPFLCVFSDEHTFADVEDFVRIYKYPVLHVSTQSSKAVIPFDEFGIKDLYSYIETVKAILPEGELLSFLRESKAREQWEGSALELKRRYHLVTDPNELVLSSFGFTFSGDDPISSPLNAPRSNAPYIQAIIESATMIAQQRSDIPLSAPPGITLILTAPSKSYNFYRVKHNINHYKSIGINNPNIVVNVLRMLQRQTNFSFEASVDDFKKIISTPVANDLFIMSRQEALTYTTAVSIIACSNFAPTLRLPPVVNTLHGDLRQLGDCVRGNSVRRHEKANKLFRRITDRLSNIVDPAYIQLIDKENNRIKLICDAPLEWLPVRGLPLMLRFDTSRVPTTPGELLFQLTTIRPQIVISPEDFQEVLIIRSFDDIDRIRGALRFATDFMLKEQPDNVDKNEKLELRLKWRDVSNEEEFIKALNEFSGAMMIFDGHGTHRKDAEFGSLLVGKKQLDIWKLRGQVRVPPIVLLSACDTHPIDASHVSVANGFLYAGATTVFATLLPIEAREAAIFTARLLLRIREYVPLLTKNGNSVRWISVVSGLQRMAFVTEILHLLMSKTKITVSEDNYVQVAFNCTLSINLGQLDWYEQMVKIFSEQLSIAADDLIRFINEWGQIPECIKYIQVGNPELILVEGNDFSS